MESVVTAVESAIKTAETDSTNPLQTRTNSSSTPEHTENNCDSEPTVREARGVRPRSRALMGANNGSGWPLFFYCAACKKRSGWRQRATRPGWHVVRTGRTRPYTGGNRGVRGTDTFHEYFCTDCGHKGWSRHKDILRKPLESPG